MYDFGNFDNQGRLIKMCGILYDFGNFDNQGRLIKEVGRGWMLKGARGDRRRAEHKTKHTLRQE